MGSFKSDLELYFLAVLATVLVAVVWWRLSIVWERRASMHAKHSPIITVLPPHVVDLREYKAKPVQVEIVGLITNVRWPINN